MRWFLFLLVACAPPVVAPTPIAPPPPAPPPAARVTCIDAGVILRSTVIDTRKAGPAKEAAIASACLHDRWSQAVLDCAGNIASAEISEYETAVTNCLAKLTTEQRAALDTKLNAWVESYVDETWITAEDERAANEPPAIPCAAVINQTNVASLLPALPSAPDERGFAINLRINAVRAACEQWPRPVRQCAQVGGSLEVCRRTLDAAQQQVLATRLQAIDALISKLAAAKAKPAPTYACKAVVAAHYSDAAWKGKAESPPDPKATAAERVKRVAERQAMIAAARKWMLDACVKEAWSPTVRACELVDGGPVCGEGAGQVHRWGFPPRATGGLTGVPECDDYALSVAVMEQCTQVPKTTRDAITQAHAQLVGHGTPSPGTAAACRQANEALKQALYALNCTP